MEINNHNKISFPKYCFQFYRYFMELDNNLNNELIDLIKRNVDSQIKNNTI